MEYEDEKIVVMKKMSQNRMGDILGEGIYANDQLVKFSKQQLFDGRIEAYLPEDFVDMPEDIIKYKYPQIGRPQIVKTNLLTSINFAFNFFEEAFTTIQAQNFALQFKDAIKKVHPANIFYDDIFMESPSGLAVNLFDFKGYGIDEQIYYIMAIIPVTDGVIHGIFNCPNRYMNDWKQAVCQVYFMVEDLQRRN